MSDTFSDKTHAGPEIAMVFAAGLGVRMRPITDTLPKPLVKIAGKTMLDHMLDRLNEAGVARAIVNVHWLAGQIEAHLQGRNTPRIIISDEREKLLDQGGGIAKVMPQFEGKPFYICNTDAVWVEGPRSNIARLAQAWNPEKMDVLLLVAASAASVGVDSEGDFDLDADGRLTKRQEGLVAPFVYAGVGIIKSSLFEGRAVEPFRLAPFFFEAARQKRLFGVRLEGKWLHVGSPQAIEEAERAYARSAL